MKLDSEEQRAALLKALGSVKVVTTMGEIDDTKAGIEAILDPIRKAELEENVEEVDAALDAEPVT